MLTVWRHLKPTTSVGPKQAKSVNCVERPKWRDPPEEIEEKRMILPTEEELKLFQSVAARFNFLAMDRPDLLYSVKELMREMASPRTQDLIALERVAPSHNQILTNGLQIYICVGLQLDSDNVEVHGDANFAEMYFYEKVHSWRNHDCGTVNL